MHNKDETIQEYALVPFEFGDNGLRNRYCFVRKGNVYLNIDCMINLLENLYGAYLKNKLEKMRIPVIEMLNNDV